MSGASASAQSSPRCAACDTPLDGVGGPGEVSHGTVAGVAVGPVAWACPRRTIADRDDDHDVRRPTPAEVAAAVRGSLDVARRTVLRGTLRCGACDTPFALPGRRTTRTVTITGAAPAVTLTLDVPVLRCTEDALENLPPEALDDALVVAEQLVARRGDAPAGSERGRRAPWADDA